MGIVMGSVVRKVISGAAARSTAFVVARASGARWTRVLLACSLACGVGFADVVKLDDGREIEGEILSAPDAAVIEVRVTIGGLTGVQRFEAKHVVSISHGPSPRQQAIAAINAKRVALAGSDGGGSADEWWALASDARKSGDPMLAKDLAAIVVERDRQHPEARKLLGQVKQNGVWMRPREAAAARGELYFRGRWTSWTEKETILASEERARQEQEIERKRLMDQRAADNAAVASYQQPQANFGVYQSVPSYGYAGGYSSYPYAPRVVYWPSTYAGYTQASYSSCQPRSGLVVRAAGSSGSTSWSINWGF